MMVGVTSEAEQLTDSLFEVTLRNFFQDPIYFHILM